MVDKALRDISRKEQARKELVSLFQVSGSKAVYKQEKSVTEKYIKNCIKNNTFVSKDAAGKKHCYVLEQALEQCTDSIVFIEHFFELVPFFAGAEEAMKIARRTNNLIFLPYLIRAEKAYTEKKQEDTTAKEAARVALETFKTIPKGNVSKFKKENKATLIHQDADGKNHCYFLECAAQDGNIEMVQELLKVDSVKKDKVILTKAFKTERKAKDQAVLEMANLKQGAGALTQSERIKQIAELEKKVESYLATDRMLLVMLKEIRENEDRNRKNEIEGLIKQSTTEMLTVLQKAESMALEDAMLDAPIKKPEELKKAYRKSDTPKTMHDHEDFNGIYNALEAITKEERKKHLEVLHKKYVHFRNMIQKDWVKTTIKVGGVVALGATSGAIGVGLYFLGKAIEFAVDTGHEAWLAKYHVLIENYLKLLDESNSILREGSAHSIETLMILRDQSEGEAKKIVEGQINLVREHITKIEELEQKSEDAAIELLTKLICSNDKKITQDANKFLKGFHQNTRKLKEKGQDAATKFRDDAKDVTDHALEKNAKASRRLSIIKPLTHVDSETYSNLTYDVLDSQGSVSDAMASLEESYQVLAEVNRREVFFIKLASALRNEEGRSLSKQLAFYKKARPEMNLDVKGQRADFSVGASEEMANMSTQSSKDTLVIEGLATRLVGSVKILQEKGIKEGLKDITVQRNIAKLHAVYGTSTLFSTLLREASDPTSVSGIFSSQARENVSSAIEYLNEYLSSNVLSGMPSAQLDIGISPVGVCTMITMFLYTGIHNAWYTKELKEKLSKILDLQNEKDISKLSDQEIMKLIKLVGETVHDFGNLLPKMMEKQLARTERLYDKQVKHSRRLAKYRATGIPESKKAKYEKKKKILDKLFKKVEKSQANTQTLYYLSSLYRELINHVSVKNRANNRDMLFVLSRQHVFTTFLKSSNIVEADYEKALPLITNYLEMRNSKINHLNYLKLLSSITPDQEAQLKKIEKEYQDGPFDFLTKLKFSDLVKMTFELNQANAQLFSGSSLLQNAKANGIKIEEVLSIKERVESLVNQGIIEKDPKIIKEYIFELKGNKPDLINFKAFLDSIEKINEHRTENKKIFDSIIKINKALWGDHFSKSSNIPDSLEKIDNFFNKITRLDKVQLRMRKQIEQLGAIDPAMFKSDADHMLKLLDKSVEKLLVDVENQTLSFEDFLKKGFEADATFQPRNTGAERLFEDTFKDVIKKMNEESLEALKKEIRSPFLISYVQQKLDNLSIEEHQKFDALCYVKKIQKLDELVSLIEEGITNQITHQPAKKSEIEEEKDKLIKHLLQVVQNDEVGLKQLTSLTYHQGGASITDLEAQIVDLENRQLQTAQRGVHFVRRDRHPPPPPPVRKVPPPPPGALPSKGNKNTR
jgi:hypothetical protein